jgi:ADP-ribose pyrophosphatase YjhB (NUDIX family)
MAYIYPFRMTSTTTTTLFLDPINREVVIGVRSDNSAMYPSHDSLPGGFMEAKWTDTEENRILKIFKNRFWAKWVLGKKIGDADLYHEGEDAQDCACREALEELSIILYRNQLVLFDVRSNARTDTRAHVTNVCYYAELTPSQLLSLNPGDDIKEFTRYPIDGILDGTFSIPKMAFNHDQIMMDGLRAWSSKNDLINSKIRVMQLEQELQAANKTIRELQE